MIKEKVKNTPYYLSELEGIGYRLVNKIIKHFNLEGAKEYSSLHQKFLKEKEFTDHYIASEILPKDPYLLIEVRGLGFKKVDAIALNNYHIDPDFPKRHYHGNRSILSFEGAKETSAYFYQRQKLQLFNKDLQFEGVVEDKGLVWLPEELAAEKSIVNFYNDSCFVPELDFSIPEAVKKITEEDTLNNEQARTVLAAVSGVKVLALTGGAGTGKTKTTAAIVKAGRKLGKDSIVLTFSGKAAQRSKEAMRENDVKDVECSTIHRALGIGTWDNESPELEQKIVILDESSMVPNWLLAKIIEALPEDATLVLVGDPNQLPPIGYGKPFETLLGHNNPIERHHLVTNYRQANQIAIHELAEAVRTGQPEMFRQGEGVDTHFDVDDNNVAQIFESMVEDSNKLGLMSWQCVTWTNAVKEQLNQHLQAKFNPFGEAVYTYYAFDLGKDDFGSWQMLDVCMGDKVMITENNYDHLVFNGETGVITNLATDEDGERCIDIDFGYKSVVMPISDAEDIVRLGYCVTTHKSQGSGWESIIVYQPFPVKHASRRFFYTAITRAKNHVHLMTSMSEAGFWKNACQVEPGFKNTLAERLNEF